MRYHLRDALRAPGLLSLARLPLAAVFPAAAARPRLGLAVLAAAGVTDVLDGWVARRFGLVTSTGAALDPVTDKLFVLSVISTLLARGDLSLGHLVLLATRDLAELPLVVLAAQAGPDARARMDAPTANAFGKVATTLQFVAAAALVTRSRHAPLCVGAAAAAGALAAASYWRRALAPGGVLHPTPA